MSKIQKIKGFSDLFAPESTVHTHMENLARETFGAYGCREIRVPILEKTELFARSIGEETDVVQKEMYTFADRKGRSLTMRPEATAGVLRSAYRPYPMLLYLAKYPMQADSRARAVREFRRSHRRW